MRGRPLFNEVAIVGLGLIGGSLGLAIKKRRLARWVLGVGRRVSTLRQAKRLGAIDDAATLDEAIRRSDMIVLATPPESVVVLAKRIIQSAKRPLILTDVASTKAGVVAEVEQVIRLAGSPVEFVGGHPVAGSERSGIEAARAILFEEAVCILTPTPRTSRSALSGVRSLWHALGSRVAELSPERHDVLVAQVSQVPHMAAVGLVNAASAQAIRVAGTGFSDATRIVQANPKLWVEIARTNGRQIVRSMDRLIHELKAIREDIAKRREKPLLKKLCAAQRRRQNFNK